MMLDFGYEILSIQGWNAALVFDEEWVIFLGNFGPEEYTEMILNHETLHLVLDKIGENSSFLDNIWWKYDGVMTKAGKLHRVPRKIREFLTDTAYVGVGFM